MVTTAKLILVMIFLSYLSSAFQFQVSYVKNPMTINTRTPTQLDIFGNAMKNAFSNDDTLGKRDDAGLKKVRCAMVVKRML